MDNDRNKMFEEMSAMSPIAKSGLISRVYGLMESYEEQGKAVDPKIFFEFVRQQINIDNQYIR